MKKIKSSTTSNQIKDGVGLGPPPVYNCKTQTVTIHQTEKKCLTENGSLSKYLSRNRKDFQSNRACNCRKKVRYAGGPH